MSSELKPCPFCGSEAELIRLAEDMFYCICSNDECSPYRSYEDEKEAITAWNQRAERTCKPKHWNNASGVAFARGECSECGGYLLENSETGKPRPYCPHCGAKVVE